MDRYRIMLGRRPPRKKKVYAAQEKRPEPVRHFILGGQRSGKTSRLCVEMAKVLQTPNAQVAFCAHNFDRASEVVRRLLGELKNTYKCYEVYPDIEHRIIPCRDICHPINVYGLFLDDIGDYGRPQEMPVFRTLDRVSASTSHYLACSCDTQDFELMLKTVRNIPGAYNLGAVSDHEFYYRGVRWEIMYQHSTHTQERQYWPYRREMRALLKE